MTHPHASIAVIGGSGLYSLFAATESTSHRVDTPYGPVNLTAGQLGGREVVFITRHGVDHSSPPHLINYRANIWALASLGVKAILSSSAVGGIAADYPPGTLALTDQFIDRTWGRHDTFYDRDSVQHLPAADPFDPALHGIAASALSSVGEVFKPNATVVVIQGPRFSTRAESLWFRDIGAHTVNMTMYPEVPLASELNMGTVNLSFVTDSDAGVAPPSSTDDEVTNELVLRRLADAQPRIVRAIETIILSLPDRYSGRELIDPRAVAAVLARPVQT